jgi:arylsulfatase A-like enzyme
VVDWLNENRRDKFFLYVHYMDVHDWWIRETEQTGVPTPTDSETATVAYRRAVQAVDDAVGDLLSTLQERGLLEDAVVVLVGDHGEALGEVHAVPGTPTHWGNPSFEAVLQVPLIVSPKVGRDTSSFVRTEDIFRLIKNVAGLRAETEHDLKPEEIFLTELNYRTYRTGRWKSVWRRPSASPLDPWRKYVDGLGPFEDYFRGHDPEQPILFDLQSDPAERRDVANAHPSVVAAHRKRIDELSRKLAARGTEHEELSPLDRERLRALGYLE